MLLSESELNMYNADSVLNEAVLLDESESITKLPAIPVVENSRIGAAVVSINDLNSIVEDYGCDYEDAFCAIAEQNELDPSSLAVSVEDWKLIETPELAGMVPNIVVKPISEDNVVYQLVDNCINEYYNTGDEGYLEFFDEIIDEAIDRNDIAAFKVGRSARRKAERILKIMKSKEKKIEKARSNAHNLKDHNVVNRMNIDTNKWYEKNIKAVNALFKYTGDTYYDDRVKEDKKILANLSKSKEYKDNLKNSAQKNKEEYLKIEREILQDIKNQETKSSTSSTHSFGTTSGNNQETKSSTTSTHSFGTSGKPAVINNNNNRGFLSNHKKAIGLGAAGLVGAALAARKIAALRKQQQQHPGLRGKLQAIINRLKSKLHK